MSHEWMARRRVLALGLGGIAGLGAQTLIGGRKAMAQGTPETVVYVSNAGSKEVFVLAMNRATGALELIEKTPVPGTDKPSPASLPISRKIPWANVIRAPSRSGRALERVDLTRCRLPPTPTSNENKILVHAPINA